MSRNLTGRVKLVDAKSAQDYASVVQHSDDVGGLAQNSVYYIVFGAGTSAGAVVIEAAHDPAYTGTWALLGTGTWSVSANKIIEIAISGNFIARRARISVAIVGGTVDVYSTISG